MTQLTLKSGAELVSAILENKEAYGFHGNARDILNKLPETEEIKKRKIEVLLFMTAPIIFLGYPAEALEMLYEGRTLSKELGDEYHIMRFCRLVGLYYTFRGNTQ